VRAGTFGQPDDAAARPVDDDDGGRGHEAVQTEILGQGADDAPVDEQQVPPGGELFHELDNPAPESLEGLTTREIEVAELHDLTGHLGIDLGEGPFLELAEVDLAEAWILGWFSPGQAGAFHGPAQVGRPDAVEALFLEKAVQLADLLASAFGQGRIGPAGDLVGHAAGCLTVPDKPEFEGRDGAHHPEQSTPDRAHPVNMGDTVLMKVVVAMSGGLDSSVAALRLVEAGHEVIGVLFRLWDPLAGAASRCCSDEDVQDAQNVAAALGIRLREECTTRRFFDEIFMGSLKQYARGLTPNPCVVCNERIKFAELEAVAREEGADAVATGHYARVERGEDGAVHLLRAVDPAKDQSYFLYRVPLRILARLILPVGALAKDEVRRLAVEAGLPVAAKGESQELCFVPQGTSYAQLVEGWVPGSIRPGKIVDREGRVLGRHGGVHRFTVGQRRGLGIAAERPLYVLALEASTGRVVVGPREELEVPAISVEDAVWIAGEPPARRFRCTVRIRSRHAGVTASVEVGSGTVHVLPEEPLMAPAPGQAAVFYHGDEVLGGGFIARDRQQSGSSSWE